MTDHLTPDHRSWNMSRIRSKDTTPEKTVRSLLHRMGYRFRIHRRDLPGKPDVVLPKYSTVIFVHGCFWHRHKGCKYTTTPKTNTTFWQEKFERNVERDRNVQTALRNQGWHVLVVWECELRELDALANRLTHALSQAPLHYPIAPSAQQNAAETAGAYTLGNTKTPHSK
ncbi:MAG: very short patch repair endonuclease [Candidatus Pacebacteria bacterium]|nr:very short patch repair endonuclease [Candidatus Paceibacterota bacterium]